MNSTQTLGRLGEDMAARYLEQQGYTILARNWRHGHREIDIICRLGDDLIFVEVKTRRGRRYGLPEESISQSKKNAVMRAAVVFMAKHRHRDIRFDVIAILLEKGVPEIFHIRDAFA
jgi:putative endonuclease